MTPGKNRSHGVHGSRVAFEDDLGATVKFGQLHRTLQLALRRAIDEPEFRALFQSDASVRERWPATETGA